MPMILSRFSSSVRLGLLRSACQRAHHQHSSHTLGDLGRGSPRGRRSRQKAAPASSPIDSGPTVTQIALHHPHQPSVDWADERRVVGMSL